MPVTFLRTFDACRYPFGYCLRADFQGRQIYNLAFGWKEQPTKDQINQAVEQAIARLTSEESYVPPSVEGNLNESQTAAFSTVRSSVAEYVLAGIKASALAARYPEIANDFVTLVNGLIGKVGEPTRIVGAEQIGELPA